ncbi:MAG: SulP family inorganic anion transporter, partial [Gammaproteobacteria bacterium]|nr:SulP family inorganic anion transporter [Gammaproteobacteria bacterium]
NGGATAKFDILSGLTVALALVPEAIAFAMAAGVPPLVGLYAACIVGFITAAIGGRPGMISGATGALAVVMINLVSQGNELGRELATPVDNYGLVVLFATVILMGIIQVGAGVFRLGKFIRMVPHPVMLGFVNGLAIVIGLAQFKQFQVPDESGNMVWMTGTPLMIMVGLIIATMVIIQFLPKITRIIPSTLAAIVALSVLVIVFNLETTTVKDVLVNMTGDPDATMSGGLPSFNIPMIDFGWKTVALILPYAFILAAIGLIESLLTLTLIDELTETRGKSNRECVGQGVANIVTGFFGGMGGCAMIGQSMININSGGRTRLSGISAAIFLLIFILFAAPLIERIPVAVLIGVMFMVVIGTFEWASLRLFGKVPAADIFVTVLVMVITVWMDLAIAVIVGVIVSALIFAWEHAKQMIVVRDLHEDGTLHYKPKGALFFGSIKYFSDNFTPKDDPERVVIDFAEARVVDHSGIEAIDALAARYERRGKELHIRHLSPECLKLLTKAKGYVDIDKLTDPDYKIADDTLES